MNDSWRLCFLFFAGPLGVKGGEGMGGVLKKAERESEALMERERERENEAWGSKEM